MIYLREHSVNGTERGDAVIAAKLHGRRVTLSRYVHAPPLGIKWAVKNRESGFTLIELVITITVLTILTMGVVPLLKLSVKRQKEQQLHDTLRQMRTAIDEFHRDTVGMRCTGAPGAPPPSGFIDPRSKVVISDCTIFGVDNPDRYPPSLETLMDGVNVIPRGGTPFNPNTPPSERELSTKKIRLPGTPTGNFAPATTRQIVAHGAGKTFSMCARSRRIRP